MVSFILTAVAWFIVFWLIMIGISQLLDLDLTSYDAALFAAGEVLIASLLYLMLV